jgi:hypothetical protein
MILPMVFILLIKDIDFNVKKHRADKTLNAESF